MCRWWNILSVFGCFFGKGVLLRMIVLIFVVGVGKNLILWFIEFR